MQVHFACLIFFLIHFDCHQVRAFSMLLKKLNYAGLETIYHAEQMHFKCFRFSQEFVLKIIKEKFGDAT